MSDKTFNIAIVGLGFGAEFIPIHQAHPNANLVAVCRRNEAEMNAFRRDGYHIARGMLAAEAPALMAEMRRPEQFPRSLYTATPTVLLSYAFVCGTGYILRGDRVPRYLMAVLQYDVKRSVSNFLMLIHIVISYVLNQQVLCRVRLLSRLRRIVLRLVRLSLPLLRARSLAFQLRVQTRNLLRRFALLSQ